MAVTGNLLAYDNAAQITCTLASLGAGSTRESASTANATAKDFDYHVQLTFTLLSGSPSTTGPYVNIYANATGQSALWPILQLSNGATKATSGTDNSIGALSTPNQLALIGTFSFQTTSSNAERTFRTQPYSVGGPWGACPYNFSILVENQTGVAFSTSTVTTAAYLDLCAGIHTTSGN